MTYKWMRVVPLMLLCAIGFIRSTAHAQQAATDRDVLDRIIRDRQDQRDLFAKQARGETLTPDEAARLQAMSDRAAEIQGLFRKRRAREALTSEEAARLQEAESERNRWMVAYRRLCPVRESTGLVPLTELVSGSYKGREGGLYPGRRNSLPEAHLKAGLERAASVAPLDAQGRPDTGGAIVFLSIGMSNCQREFETFQEMVRLEPGVKPAVVLVNGAQSGQTAEIIAHPGAPHWRIIDERLDGAGVSAAQVQAVWVKQTRSTVLATQSWRQS